MSHEEIKDAWFAEDAMVTSGLLGRYRDNIIALHNETTGCVHKDNDETITSSTTLQNDDDLAVAVGANEMWHVHISLEYSTPAAADFKFKLTLPSSGATGYMVWTHDIPGGDLVHVETDLVDAEIAVTGGIVTDGHIFLDAYCTMGTTAGTINFQWAQNTSNGGNTTVSAGSLLIAHRLDAEDGTKTYSEIASTDVDGKSPGETGLGAKLRDNPLALHDNNRFGAIKTVDETVNNSTTVQADDDLLFAVGANETWQFTVMLKITTNVLADWKFGFEGPAGSSGVFGYMWTSDPTPPGGTFFSQGATGVVNTLTELIQWDDNAVDFGVLVEGYVSTAGTGGNLTLKWAQQTADASDTKVLAGSFLAAHRLDAVSPTGAVYTTISDADIDPESDIDDSSNVFALLANNAPAVYNSRAFATKASDETVNNSAALQDDDDLVFSVGAGECWCFIYVLNIETTGAASFKFLIDTPDAGDDGHIFWNQSLATVPPGDPVIRAKHGDINTSLSLVASGSGILIAHAVIEVAGVAGSVTLQWAQDSATAVDTKVLAGSFLYARRMDDLT